MWELPDASGGNVNWGRTAKCSLPLFLLSHPLLLQLILTFWAVLPVLHRQEMATVPSLYLTNFFHFTVYSISVLSGASIWGKFAGKKLAFLRRLFASLCLLPGV